MALGWDVVLAGFVATTAWVVARRAGPGAAIALLGLGVGVPVALSAVDRGGALGTWLPCRRNWAWQPSYFLRSSPTMSLRTKVADVRVKVCYGRPRARGRHMIGGSPVPYGQLWRTGANEPTTIRAAGPITIAGILIADSKASLYTIPGPETWEIILNRSTSQWGLESEYTEAIRSQELGRTVVPSRPLPTHVEAMELDVDPNRDATAELVLRWELTEVRLPLAAAHR